MIGVHVCFNCDDKAERPVIVDSEPKTIWCLDCAWYNGLSFSTPKGAVSYTDLEDAKTAWGCSLDEAYDRVEDGEDWQTNCFEDDEE